MARTLLNLAERLEEIAGEVEKKSSDVSSKVALTILGDLVYVTPVDTSKALSNWQIGLGEPVDSAIAPYYPGKSGSTRNASAQAALSKAKFVLQNKKPGESIFISNVLPYIRRLNNGHSGQAPIGFVERAILLGRTQAEKLKVEL